MNGMMTCSLFKHEKVNKGIKTNKQELGQSRASFSFTVFLGLSCPSKTVTSSEVRLLLHALTDYSTEGRCYGFLELFFLYFPTIRFYEVLQDHKLETQSYLSLYSSNI